MDENLTKQSKSVPTQSGDASVKAEVTAKQANNVQAQAYTIPTQAEAASKQGNDEPKQSVALQAQSECTPNQSDVVPAQGESVSKTDGSFYKKASVNIIFVLMPVIAVIISSIDSTVAMAACDMSTSYHAAGTSAFGLFLLIFLSPLLFFCYGVLWRSVYHLVVYPPHPLSTAVDTISLAAYACVAYLILSPKLPSFLKSYFTDPLSASLAIIVAVFVLRIVSFLICKRLSRSKKAQDGASA